MVLTTESTALVTSPNIFPIMSPTNFSAAHIGADMYLSIISDSMDFAILKSVLIIF